MKKTRLLSALFAVLAISCAESEAGEHELVAVAVREAPAGAVIDSATAIDEALDQFREDLQLHPTALSGGADSRDDLVRRFVEAIEAQDTTALREMVVSRAEFAYLYYPFSRYVRPPLEMEPGLVWFLTQQNSEKGITRVLRRLGGRELGFAGYRCDAEPERQEQNLLWSGCELELRAAPDDFPARRLFGTVLERGGHFKLVSYANDL